MQDVGDKAKDAANQTEGAIKDAAGAVKDKASLQLPSACHSARCQHTALGKATCRTSAHEQSVHKVPATKRMHHTRALLLGDKHPSHGFAARDSEVPSCRLPMPRTL